MSSSRLASRVLVGLAVYGVIVYAALAAIVGFKERDPDKRAVFCMASGLILIWIVLGGTLMRLGRDRFKDWVGRIRIGWRTRFVLLCVVMALLEEVVTTSMTNLAPFFGGVTEAARITASKNYLEVVLLHSVVVFWPSYVAWAVLLSYIDFSPAEVMLLYGLTGTLAEAGTFGAQHLAGVGMWSYVYGLMVYLPACTVPRPRNVRPVRWWHWPMAVVVGLFACIPFVPVVLLVRRLLGYAWPGAG